MSIWEVIAYVCFTIAAIDSVFMIILVYRNREKIREEVRRGKSQKAKKEKKEVSYEERDDQGT